MSWYIKSYLTDAEKLKKVYGCKNKLFTEKIMLKMRDFLDDLDSDYEEQITFEKNASAVLLDFINGKTSFKDINFMYVLIYERLCDIFGEQVFSPNDEYSVPYFKALEQKSTVFLPIPTEKKDPFVVSILHKDLARQKEWYLSLTKPDDMSQKEFDTEQADYAFVFDKAIKEGKDLVFTMY